MTFRHEFVETIPKELAFGVLYVSIEFATVIHACACGCGNRVVTRLSPTNWQLTFDGRTVTLHPSIGNWSFPCRSHYWIRHDEVVWAETWEEHVSRKLAEKADSAKDRGAKIGVTVDHALGSRKSPGEAHPSLWKRVLRALGFPREDK